MTLPRLTGDWSKVDTSYGTWRGRAIRYVLIYLTLVLALVLTRYLTQQVRPQMLAAQGRESALINERDDLIVRVQTLENPQRIRDWAFANGMRRFAEAPKELQAIPATDAPGTPRELTVTRTVEVRTQWK